MSPVIVLALAAAATALGATIGMRRSRAATGRVDPFHPLLFPAIYVGTATLLPAWWILVLGHDLGYVRRSAFTSDTPLHLALAVVGFTIGAALPFRRPSAKQIPLDRKTLAQAGTVLLLILIWLAAGELAAGGVRVRALDQGRYTLIDSIRAGAMILAPVSAVLVLAGRVNRPHILTGLDWILVTTLIGILGLTGRRGAALAIMITVLLYLACRGRSIRRIAIGFAGVALFAYQVVAYRSEALGERSGLGAIGMLLRDVGSVAFTTGLTDRLMRGNTLDGATITAGLIRQIPSPIANSLLGPVVDAQTGALHFRRLTDVGSDSGYGYSLPAEGVLNFGTAGAFLLPLVVGAVLAWLYTRFQHDGTRPLHFAYAFAVATLPFAWRSDVLGATKGVLYPLIVVWLACVIARTVRASLPRLRRSSVSVS